MSVQSSPDGLGKGDKNCKLSFKNYKPLNILKIILVRESRGRCHSKMAKEKMAV